MATQTSSLSKQLYFHTWCPRMVQKSITDDAGTLELLHNADIPRQMVLFFTDLKMNDGPALGTNNAGNSHNPLAMIHANLSQLRVIINDESVFDSPLKFDWECSQNTDGTYFYDYNKSSYLRGYNQLQDFSGRLTVPRYPSRPPIIATTSLSYLSTWISTVTSTTRRWGVTYPSTINSRIWPTAPLAYPVPQVPPSRPTFSAGISTCTSWTKREASSGISFEQAPPRFFPALTQFFLIYVKEDVMEGGGVTWWPYINLREVEIWWPHLANSSEVASLGWSRNCWVLDLVKCKNKCRIPLSCNNCWCNEVGSPRPWPVLACFPCCSERGKTMVFRIRWEPHAIRLCSAEGYPYRLPWLPRVYPCWNPLAFP